MINDRGEFIVEADDGSLLVNQGTSLQLPDGDVVTSHLDVCLEIKMNDKPSVFFLLAPSEAKELARYILCFQDEEGEA